MTEHADTPREIIRKVGSLVDAWCDRRALRALREILAGWPLTSLLTDDWANLLSALESVRAFAREELTKQELDTVEAMINAARRIVERRD